MTPRKFFVAVAVCCALFAAGCKREPVSTTPAPSPKATAASAEPAALPENGYKASIELIDPPSRLRAGQKETIQVKVKNASEVMWYARGAAVNNAPTNKFYIAVGDRWFKADGATLVTDMDGRYGIGPDLKPGEETVVPLLITAPKEPGDYILDIDLVQEQVTWFHEKGSPTAKTKVTVVK